MQAGEITIDGVKVGVIEVNLSDEVEPLFNFEGYTPTGRAKGDSAGVTGAGGHHPGAHHSIGHPSPGSDHGHRNQHHDHEMAPRNDEGKAYEGRTYPQGSVETDEAIQRAARHAGVDPNTMRSIASIESGMVPSSNATRATQYKGLYQIGREEWRRSGAGGNIYSSNDNAMAAARLFRENKSQFRSHFGRDPNDTELYLMHQQGLGFYTRGAMTNISGNPYPGMSGPQTHESFEAGWGREVARRKAAFAKSNPTPQAKVDKPIDISTEPM